MASQAVMGGAVLFLQIQPGKHLRTTCPNIYAKTFFILLQEERGIL